VDLFDLSGERAVVTGGAGRIGAPVCRALADHGADVVVADVDREAGERLAADLDGGSFVACDVTDADSVTAAFEAVDDGGGLDVLVNAAYPRDETYGDAFETRDDDDLLRQLDAQIGACFRCCRAAVERLADGGGSVVNFGSTYGVQAPDFAVYEEADMPPSPAHYSASKGAILNLTRYLASYLGDVGVRVNAVSPGGVFDDQDPAFVEAYERRVPLGRMARGTDLRGAVVYLASDAAGYVTGHNLVVDGGWTVR
jgi:NAD(P)-dependent dehydrogenase (short-subunit alcohol dehydrogenase family)